MRARENMEELFRLIKENPELPIVPMVDAEIVAEDCGYWLGAFGRAEVDEYFFRRETKDFSSRATVTYLTYWKDT